MAGFTPYSYVAKPRGQSPYVPINPALQGLGLRMPQMTPEQLEQGKKEAWLQQTSGAVEPVAYVEGKNNAVQRKLDRLTRGTVE